MKLQNSYFVTYGEVHKSTNAADTLSKAITRAQMLVERDGCDRVVVEIVRYVRRTPITPPITVEGVE